MSTNRLLELYFKKKKKQLGATDVCQQFKEVWKEQEEEKEDDLCGGDGEMGVCVRGNNSKVPACCPSGSVYAKKYK